MIFGIGKGRKKGRGGWQVEVEHPEGVIFYIVATEDPIEAENIVRTKAKIPVERDVLARKPVDEQTIKTFRLKPGEIVGPM